MSVSSLLRRGIIAAVAVVASSAALPAATAEEAVSILAGDGGIITEHCGARAEQVRVDSSSLGSLSACFALVRPTGWAAMHLTGSYGLVNNLTVPVSVAFKLPDGAVYWQATVQPGQVSSVDVNNAGSTIVELHVSPVATSTGASTASLTPGTPGAPNYVSLRSASPATFGRVARVSWLGATTSDLTRNSSFPDRLDGSFLVTTGLSDPACISLESAAYPGTYLQATSRASVSLSAHPTPAHATWCAIPDSSVVTSTRLVWAADRSTALAVTPGGGLGLAAVNSADSRWFSDQALARP
ncbi:hypothetical protein GC425_01810 [Corynebacterium sp. zg254]|uniref:Alpha-L-arabinofuranosidase B arabinose-binding domain-containing protein n=1 Tax=Corynebacterium zhongnanshanii TaxID=2768834 RepID=A0ABQ6VFT8_9CORY|nr:MULTISPECIES: AbfB domain-containing protein [Corynebacterium]KAB3523275.1 hypothetical protein F8377_03815 [Corynebacterium zhongnanshanii]MCR5913605.1 hypothetical protein [Corynebacterium sp. zg254]